MKYKLEYIEWVDHCSYKDTDWRDPMNNDLEPMLVYSVGYVIKETKKKLVVVPHIGKSGHMSFGEMCIIKCCIKKRKRIRLK